MDTNINEQEVTRYEPPTVVDYGDIFEITAAGGTHGRTDASFPAGTPGGNITFS